MNFPPRAFSASSSLPLLFDQLGRLLAAGVGLLPGLAILERNPNDPRLGRVFADLRRAIENGAELSDAMQRHPGYFNARTLRWIRVGEANGRLGETLAGLAQQTQRARRMRAELERLTIYPAAILLTAISGTLFTLTVAVPRLKPILLGNYGYHSSYSMRILVATSDWMLAQLAWWPLWLIGSCLTARWALRAVTHFRESPVWRYRYFRLIRAIPWLGAQIDQMGMSRLFGAMASLRSAGAPLLDSMRLASACADDPVLETRVARWRRAIVNGATLGQAISADPTIPQWIGTTVEVGESAGETDAALARLGRHFEEEAEGEWEIFLAWAPTALTLLVAAFPFTVYLYFMLSIFSPFFCFGTHCGW